MSYSITLNSDSHDDTGTGTGETSPPKSPNVEISRIGDDGSRTSTTPINNETSDLLNAIQLEKQYRITPAQQMLSSCTGALLVSAIVTPLDVVKIRLQSQQKAMLSNRCFVYCNGLMDHICDCVGTQSNDWIKRNGHFTSSTDAFTQIIRKEGISSLWSGLPPTLVMAVPATIAYFVTYEQLRVLAYDAYKKTTGFQVEQPLWIPFIAGITARAWAVTIVSPLELLRTKMQSKPLSYKELTAACRSLMEAKGIRGFWMGWGATIMRDVPFSGIYWTTYELIKKLGGQHQNPSMAFSFMAGATAGSIAGALTLPFDVVKTHKQIELGEAGFSVKGVKLQTTTDVLKKIYKSQGIKGLFAGFTPRVVKVAPACAIMISTYEYGKSFFMRYNKQQKQQSKSLSNNSEDIKCKVDSQ